MALIELYEIGKVYHSDGSEVHAIQDVDLTIEEGEIVTLMGPSGSGKSTLLTILGAMNPPTAGQMFVDEIDVYKLSVEQRADFRHEYLGFVFQQLQLIPYLTAIENVMLPLAISKRSHKEQRAMAELALERVGLGDKMSRLPSQLSGGEQERVAIARAIVNRPPIVLADEPTGSLDTKTGDEVMELFRDLNEEGLTILIVTHNPENTRYSQRTIYIRDGRIVSTDFKLDLGPAPVPVNVSGSQLSEISEQYRLLISVEALRGGGFREEKTIELDLSGRDGNGSHQEDALELAPCDGVLQGCSEEACGESRAQVNGHSSRSRGFRRAKQARNHELRV